MLDPTNVNFLAVIVAAIVAMIVGFLWYSPYLFGNAWMDALGYKKEDMKGEASVFIGGFLSALLKAFVLALFIRHLGADTAWEGACIAFWVWLGFLVTSTLGGVLWERMPLKVFFIHIGCSLVIVELMGVILALWQ